MPSILYSHKELHEQNLLYAGYIFYIRENKDFVCSYHLGSKKKLVEIIQLHNLKTTDFDDRNFPIEIGSYKQTKNVKYRRQLCVIKK